MFKLVLRLKEISGQPISRIARLKVEQNHYWAATNATEFDSAAGNFFFK